MTEEDHLSVALQQGRAALSAGMHELAADFLEEALSLARSLGDDLAEASTSGLLSQVYLRLDQPEEAARLAEDALNIASARHDDDAARHFQGLLMIARATPDERQMSTAFGDGRQALIDDEPERALPLLERALELATTLGRQVARSAAHLLLAQTLLKLGRRDEAVTHATEGKNLAEAQGDAEAVQRAAELIEAIESDEPSDQGIQSEIEWGKEALTQGDLDRGIRHLERARDQAQKLNEPIPEAAASGLLAQAFIEAGRRDEAEASARHALGIAESLGHHEAAEAFQGLVQAAAASEESHSLTQELHLGSVALESGDPDKALSHLELALEQSVQSSHEVAEALACGLLARAHHSLGHRDEALGLARRALEISERRGEEKATTHFQELIETFEKS
jgi:tetratricopeptide (TPR) repeat protein